MPPRFASPDRLKDPSSCPLFDDRNRVNYNFGKPEIIPDIPVPCPFASGKVACGELITFTPIQAPGMEHIANSRRADNSPIGAVCPTERANTNFSAPVLDRIFRELGD